MGGLPSVLMEAGLVAFIKLHPSKPAFAGKLEHNPAATGNTTGGVLAMTGTLSTLEPVAPGVHIGSYGGHAAMVMAAASEGY